ncbi:MAG: DUF2703 domain-containing protein [Nitrospirota bacterium]
MLKIDFLFWNECPSHPKAWERLHEVLDRQNIQAEIRRIEVTTEEEAEQHRFPGSPTIRIDGRDIDPGGTEHQRFGLSCRIYHDATGRGIPVPTEELIQNALEKNKKTR